MDPHGAVVHDHGEVGSAFLIIEPLGYSRSDVAKLLNVCRVPYVPSAVTLSSTMRNYSNLSAHVATSFVVSA